MMDTILDLIETAAVKVADGTGFWIVFGSYMSMMFIERLAYLFIDRDHWNEREAWANVANQLFNEAVGALITGALFMGIYLFVYTQARLFDVPFLCGAGCWPFCSPIWPIIPITGLRTAPAFSGRCTFRTIAAGR